MKFRKLSILVVALMLTVSLAACGDSPTATSAPATTAAATTTAVATTTGVATATKAATTTVAATATKAVTTVATSSDAQADIPVYSGATAVTVPDTVKSQFSSSAAGVKNSAVTAFKTSDDTAQVKSGLSDGFKKNGWDDKTSDATAAMGDAAKQMEAAGVFVIGYQKGSKAAVVIGLPGTLGGALGLTSVGEKDTVYMVFSGDK